MQMLNASGKGVALRSDHGSRLMPLMIPMAAYDVDGDQQLVVARAAY